MNAVLSLCLSHSRCVCLSSLCISLARPGSAGGVSSPSLYDVCKRERECVRVRVISLSVCVQVCLCLSVCLSVIEGGSKERESAQDLQIA